MKICRSIAVLIFAALASQAGAALQLLLTNTVHLGIQGDPEWDVFEGKTPAGSNLVLRFTATRSLHEATLRIRQDDVKQDWPVLLNGKKIGSLFLMEANLVHLLPIPAGTLRDGVNELRISTKAPEDILIHEIALADVPSAQLTSGARIEAAISDLELHQPLPCRLTVLDERGALAALNGFGAASLAVRPGVIYSGDGHAVFGLMPGRYTIYANRGPEYSCDTNTIEVQSGTTQHLEFHLARTVNTRGWAAADTHLHTFEFSRHGDATLRERLITIAGEGIELPVSAEHNQHASYLPEAKALGLDRYFTIIPGNEVTTARGHFNSFPVSLSAAPPSPKLTNWPALFRAMRAVPGVQVITLNHPDDVHAGFTPFAATNFNPVTGRSLRGDFPFEFDAMEVINSGAMRTDWMEPFRDWFALLNRGLKITGIAGSDSHDVSRFIAGQGRTCIAADDSDPARMDVAQVCRSLKAGRVIASLGLFPLLRISAATSSPAGPGEQLSASGSELELRGTVDFPAWMDPANPRDQFNLRVFGNGREIAAFTFAAPFASRPLAFAKRIPKPRQDTWYVALASGPGVTNACWAVARPYQPSSIHWKPVLLGCTNPVRVDADADGHFVSPRELAEQIVSKTDGSPEPVLKALAPFDWATAAQAAEQLHLRGTDLQSPGFRAALENAAPETRAGFRDFMATLSQ